MSVYIVRIATKDGVVERTFDVASPELARNEAQKEGVVIEVKTAKHTGGSLLDTIIGFIPIFGGKKKIKPHDKILIAKNLSAMLSAGLAVSRALHVIERQAKNQKLKAVITQINQNLSEGKTLHEALAQHPKVFPHIFVAMVKAGEESGSLAESLNVVGLQMERAYDLNKKVKGAMMYPGVILCAMGIIAFFMLTYVVPAITSTFAELKVPLPITTRIIIAFSDIATTYWYLLVIGLIGAVTGFIYGLKTKKGKRAFDWFVLHLPVIKVMVKETNAARTARTMSSLLSAGVDILGAAEITEDVLQNTYYKDVMKKAHAVIEKGEPLSNLYVEHEVLYPPFVGEMVAVGEETGQMANMLLSVANYYEHEVEMKTKDISLIIEPVLMIIIGLAVGVFAISMMGPIYSIGDAIK